MFTNPLLWGLQSDRHCAEFHKLTRLPWGDRVRLLSIKGVIVNSNSAADPEYYHLRVHFDDGDTTMRSVISPHDARLKREDADALASVISTHVNAAVEAYRAKDEDYRVPWAIHYDGSCQQEATGDEDAGMTVEQAIERCKEILASMPGAEVGSRNNAALEAAHVKIGCGLISSDFMPMFRAWNTEKCDPPLDEKELAQIVQRATLRPRYSHGELLKGKGDGDRNEA